MVQRSLCEARGRHRSQAGTPVHGGRDRRARRPRSGRRPGSSVTCVAEATRRSGTHLDGDDDEGAAHAAARRRQGPQRPDPVGRQDRLYLLHARGFGVGSGIDDTVFGAPLEDAIRSFQRHAGLKVDGVIGPKTWPALVRPPNTPRSDHAQVRVHRARRPRRRGARGLARRSRRPGGGAEKYGTPSGGVRARIGS